MLGLDPEPGFDPAALVRSLLTAAAATADAFDRELAANGLPTRREAHALLVLGRGRSRRMQVGDLALQVGLSAAAATRLVERLETASLVERAAGRTDRRASWVVLTAEGTHVVRRVRGAAQRVVRRLANRLEVRQLRALATALDALSPPLR
jgi:DNA-binding MarR family transcriptional regulator